jgi:hypothetical protein
VFWWVKDEVIRQLEQEKDAYWVFFAADFQNTLLPIVLFCLDLIHKG